MSNYRDKIYLTQAQLDTLAGGGSLSDGTNTYTGDENVVYLVPKEPVWASLDSSNIGAITSSEIVSGAFYRNNIAISDGLANVKAAVVKMSNNATYPAIINGTTQLVIFNATDFSANSITVTAVYVSK